MAYSRGVFFRLLNNDLNDWQQQLEFITSLPHLQHVELWMENLDLDTNHINWLNQNLKPYTKIIHAPWNGFQPLSYHASLRQAAIAILTQTIGFGTQVNAQLITLHLGSLIFFESPSVRIHRLDPLLFVRPRLAAGGDRKSRWDCHLREGDALQHPRRRRPTLPEDALPERNPSEQHGPGKHDSPGLSVYRLLQPGNAVEPGRG